MKNNLKMLREKTILSLRDVSDRIYNRYNMNLDSSTLSRMENGKQGIYDEQAVVLADFFNVSIDTLLNRDFKQTNPEPLILEKPPTYMNILQGLDDCTDEQLGRISNIINEYLLPRRAKAKADGAKPGTGNRLEHQKEGSPKGDSNG